MNPSFMRPFVTTLVALLLATFPAVAETPITIGFQPTMDVMPAFIAKEQGMFARHGIDATLTGGSGAIQVSGVVAKSLQIGNPTVPQVLQAIDSGLDLVIIAGANLMSAEAAEFAMVVRKGAGLREAKDFAGHRVAVNTVGAFLHVLFVQWLKNHGTDPQLVTFVEVPFPQMSDVLRQGTVDAVISVEPFVGRMVSADVGTSEDGFVRDFPKGMPVAVYAAERGWAEAHRAEVEGFRLAMGEAIASLAQNPKQAQADTLKYLKLPAEVLAHATLPDLAVGIPQAGLAQWIAIMEGQKLVTGKLDASRILWK